MQLELNERELTLVNDVLTNYLGDLRAEIGKTENFDMRQNLKGDEEVIKGLIARMESMLSRVSSTT